MDETTSFAGLNKAGRKEMVAVLSTNFPPECRSVAKYVLTVSAASVRSTHHPTTSPTFAVRGVRVS